MNKRYFFLAFFIFLLVTASVRPWHYDEGWVLKTVDHSIAEGRYSYFFILDDAEYTFVKPWFYALRYVRVNGAWEYISVRIPSVILMFLSFCVFLEFIARLSLLNIHTGAMIFFLFSIFSFYFGVTARPDSAVFFIAVLALWLQVEHKFRTKVRIYVVGLCSMPVAMSVHPIGLFFVPLMLGNGLLLYRYLSGKRVCILAFSFIFSLCVGLRLILWDLRPEEFLSAYALIQNEHNHNYHWYEEAVRYADLYAQAPFFYYYYILGYIICISYFFDKLKSDGFAWRLLSLALYLYFFLLLFPSKWCYYLNILMPFVTFCYIQRYQTFLVRYGFYLSDSSLSGQLKFDVHDGL